MVTFLKELMRSILSLFRRRQEEQQLAEELQFHLERQVEQNLAAGMTPAEARYAALRLFGGVQQIKEECRDMRRVSYIENLVQDLRYGLRTLRKNPGFTAVGVLTLALGIGANTAIFSLIDAFLLRELPVKDPQELVLIDHVTPKGGLDNSFPYPIFEQLRDRNHLCSGMFAWDGSTMSVTIDGQPEFVSGDFVSGSYFHVMGVRAMLGRTFTADDDRPGKPTVAVISDAYWKRRFSQDPSVIRKSIYLAGTPFAVIGVMPPTFYGRSAAGRSADVMLPMFVHPWLGLKDHDTFELMARLKRGVTTAQAQADLDVIYRQALTQGAGSRMSRHVEQEIRAQKIQLEPGSRGAGQGDREHFAIELRILMCHLGPAARETS